MYAQARDARAQNSRDRTKPNSVHSARGRTMNTQTNRTTEPRDASDKIVSNWWYYLPIDQKERFMIGKEWPDNIPDRVLLMHQFFMDAQISATSLYLCGTRITLREMSPGVPVDRWGAMRYKHTVTIEANGVTQEFDYYGSINDYEAGKDRLSDDDLKNVLKCVLDDGMSGFLGCKEFFAEFGYDDPCEGMKAYRACVRTAEKLYSMGWSEDMLYDIHNHLLEVL